MKPIFFTTHRRQGHARAPGVLEQLLKHRGLPTAVATAEQVHGSKIVVVPALRGSKRYAGADGLLTDRPNQPLAIFTADCAALFLSDKDHRLVGVLHAGWRGTRAAILIKAVRLVRQRWGIRANRLQVWLSPSIGPCCFEVQWEVARYFPKARQRRVGRWYVDLARQLQIQVRRAGAQFLRTEAAASCTMHGERFYSYRRDRTDKRMASVIMRTT